MHTRDECNDPGGSSVEGFTTRLHELAREADIKYDLSLVKQMLMFVKRLLMARIA
jgi:hypothetical protein